MKILAKVRYLGTSYHGWQKQNNAISVQEVIENKLSQVLNEEVCIYGSGRTDAGVHALGQTFHFSVDKEVDLNRLLYSLNMILPRDIEILSFEEVDESFHARYSAKKKHYQYKIYLAGKNPFYEGKVYFFPYSFDFNLFEKALKKFVGKHDFKDFTSKEEDEDSFIREIYDINVNKKDSIVTIDLFGNGFMRYMIRFIISTALQIATNKEDISFIDNHLDKGDRDIISYKAPSEGLYLAEVIY